MANARFCHNCGSPVDDTAARAVFGAPAALEDHAVRACPAAPGLVTERDRGDRDGALPRLRAAGDELFQRES
ncbi:hypothetical protein A4G27_03000 [Mycobacterium kansasii]|nr:hypothetical protein A4G27_03000 [Mycobacterium kansasii]